MFKKIIKLLVGCFFVFGLIYVSKNKLNNKSNADFICPSWLNEPETCNEFSYLNEHSTLLPENFSIEEKAYYDTETFTAIKENENIHTLFARHKVSQEEINKIAKKLSLYIRARDLNPGDLYFYEINEKSIGYKINKFVLIKQDQNRIPITYELSLIENDFVLKKTQPIVKKKIGKYLLEIKKTLYDTFMSRPFGNELMDRFMTVFAWQMQMPKEVNKRDVIEILAEEKYIDDKFIGYGNIKAAKYIKPQKIYEAYYFESKDGKVKGFFNEEGKSLEKEFLASPVLETTSTSSKKWRFHPVRKIRIKHNGTDYRGTIGTPFFALADGVVTEKMYDKNAGNMIRIRHKYGVYSEYFHADKIVESLKEGSKVYRGQEIGYIGNTGRLCTGPHLHLGLYTMQGEKKKFIDLSSLRNIAKNEKSLDKIYFSEFNMEKNVYLALLDSMTQMHIMAAEKSN